MSLGALARRILPTSVAKSLGILYRRMFLNMPALAEQIANMMPPSARVLDIGGGDGLPLNYLLTLRPDIHVRMMDTRHPVGGWLDQAVRKRVVALPVNSIETLVAIDDAWRPDAILVADVLHHVPAPDRPDFFIALGALLSWAPSAVLIVKDVEPGHWRSALGLWSDRYVTGDRSVELVDRRTVVAALCGTTGNLKWGELDLYRIDAPNYVLWFSR